MFGRLLERVCILVEPDRNIQLCFWHIDDLTHELAARLKDCVKANIYILFVYHARRNLKSKGKAQDSSHDGEESTRQRTYLRVALDIVHACINAENVLL